MTKHQDTRLQLLETGCDILATQGFSSVGLSALLKAAGVPKGSFYHYFKSKEQYGEAVLAHYLDGYMSEFDSLCQDKADGKSLLIRYFRTWQESYCDCLVVKLGAEVADLSETMRLTLQRGTDQIIQRLASLVDDAIEDGSLARQDSRVLAASLYQLWLGATLLSKLCRDKHHLDHAMAMTMRMLTA